ncbi:hypothetical protein AG4045_002451 [Apium graveolens]|uniref:Uncharacterized protein n=1 Tax=Apium graveolens TaxID=4045 RepID=A0A6L5B7X0_APIGR|nr:hypothetical protein AG4045_002451 [Apium graveolens]
MTYFLAELGIINYATVMYCPSMITTSTIYRARCTLKKASFWNETLALHTGFSEPQLIKALRESMCFMMDPTSGKKICYVQFPQRFDGIDRHDRYSNRNVVFFDINMKGLPSDGTVSGGINQDGIDFYNSFIDELIKNDEKNGELLKIKYHAFPENAFCSGATIVSRNKDCQKDDGWIVTYVHNEDANISQVNPK